MCIRDRYLPILVLIVLSFNNSKSKVKWGGFTLDWYITVSYTHLDVYKRQTPSLHTITKNRLSIALIQPEIIKKISGLFVSPTARKIAAP